jgi:hypothetical protein
VLSNSANNVGLLIKSLDLTFVFLFKLVNLGSYGFSEFLEELNEGKNLHFGRPNLDR